jgi:hypothetical protein
VKIDENERRTVFTRKRPDGGQGIVVRGKAKKKLTCNEAWEKQEKKEKRKMKKAFKDM